MAEWDSPMDGGHNIAVHNRDAKIHDPSTPNNRLSNDGLLDPFVFIRFIFSNIGKILLLTMLLSIIGIVLFQMIPFPYTAKAIILVDPREKGIKVSEQVVTNIDGDAAVLASIVELVQSDGFIRPLLDKLDVASDPEFAQAAQSAIAGDNRKLLTTFKKGLSVLRLGATYVVEVKYTSPNSEKSAFYANGIAKAFVDAQSTSQVEATANAASSLSDRLSDLRNALQKSEKAVADFRTKNSIVNVDAVSTLQQRELAELSQQVAQAKSTTEVWRAQYDQVRINDSNIFNTLGDQAENGQLQSLRQQRNQINQNLAELNLIFGARHPRIAAEQSKLTSLDQQITNERQRLVSLSKRRLDAAIATENALQNDLETLRDKVAGTENALVTLAELEREATANREIFQNFLSRFKSADQQQGFQNQEARLVSEATAPLNTSQPNIILASGLITVVSFILSTMIIFIRETTADRHRSVNRQQAFSRQMDRAPNQPVSYTSAPPTPITKAPPAPQVSAAPHNSFDFSPPPPVLPSHVSNRAVERNFHVPTPKNIRKRQTGHGAQGNYDFRPAKSIAGYTQTDALEQVAGLSHIPRSNLRSEFDLEKSLAEQLANISGLLPAPKRAQRNGSGTVILVSSWFPKEGKTLISQSIATLAASNQFDSILVKTPINSEIESHRGYSSTGMYRPYSVLDPVNENRSNLPVDMRSFSAVEAIIAECRKAFGFVVLDASHISNEQSFGRLSAACDKTLIILDRPDDNKIGIIAEKTTRSNFKDVKIVLNNL